MQLGLRRRGGQHRLYRAKQRCLNFRQEWLRHRRGAEVHRDLRRQIDDVAFEDGADFQPPLLAARQVGTPGDRPEPQRAPVIHHQLEAAVRRRVVVVTIQQAFGADGFLLRARGAGAPALPPARSRRERGRIVRPERQRVFGARAILADELDVL
ncbi:MAG: hypothetical protein AW07_03737 [Candidatus Accumulibacter sp. SK-11]|nr:MAG: hypothetical protein AW07_03737 [Candidatus Accumulibacter sp. SK-11]